MLGFGMPALQLAGRAQQPVLLVAMALVLSYGAYVAEVFRVRHRVDPPLADRRAPTRSALSRAQAMRHVVVPQAVRRVIPPLLNDFVSLQKDTALVSSVALFDAVFTARDYGNYNFNYTPYVVVSCFFVVLTIPLARFTDWLAASDGGAGAGGGAVTGPLLEVTGLRKTYGDKVVLADIDLTVAPRRRGLPDRVVRFGQVDPAALREPARGHRRRGDPLRGPRGLRPAGRTGARSAAGWAWSSRPTTSSRT